MDLDVESARRSLVQAVHAAPRPSPSFDLVAYLSSPVPVLGLSVPQMREVVAGFAKEHRGLPVADVNRLAGILWPAEIFEDKILAVMLLERYAKVLDDSSWSLAGSWVDGATGWGLSDALAAGPLATMAFAKPARFRELLRWTRSRNLWRRRASAYALRGFVRAKGLDRPLELLERLLYDEELWVQRAVGSWLRECWKVDAKRTEAFLRKHVRGLPPVVITVATERAAKAFRNELRKRSKSKLRGAATQSRAGPRSPRR